MGCCGQNRATLKNSYKAASLLPESPLAQAAISAAFTATAATRVRYLNGGHVLVRGPRTGWQYEFSAASPVQAVDSRDAKSFLATGLFERVGGH